MQIVREATRSTPYLSLTIPNQMASIRIFFISLLFSLIFATATAQLMTPEDYINTYKEAAIQNMFNKKIPASITLAQGMLESGNGNSVLAKKGNNHLVSSATTIGRARPCT